MIEEIEAPWIAAGRGCDGDRIAITAAMQPRTSADTGQPVPACDWIDGLAPRAWASRNPSG
jgi:hypothetical protein